MNKLKILHLLSQRPDSTGSGIYVQAMIREAAAHGHDNFLVAGVRSDQCDETACIEPGRFLSVGFHGADLAYHIPGMSDVMPYDSTRFCDLSQQDLQDYERAFSVALRQAVNDFKPDIIHSHHLWLVSSLTRRLFPETPMVTTCHGTDLRQFQNCPHLQHQVLAGCRGIDRVMALSETQKQDIVRLYQLTPDRIVVTGAGYNDSFFYPTSKPAPSPVRLVYAGKLSRAKGVPWLLRALRDVHSPDWRLHLIGGGSGKEKTDCLRLTAELEGRVIIHGPLSQDRLAEIVRQCHLLVLPSFFEGLPLIVLEGLAAGCRIIATDLPGIREVLSDLRADFICLVQPPRLRGVDQPITEDEQSFEQRLADALQRQVNAAATCPDIDLSGIQEKLEGFSWQSVFKKVLRVYHSCFNKIVWL